MSQRKTILITGTSSGIGRATAFHFQRQGWQVIATMRSPEHETELNRLPGVICLGLDVNDDASIRMAVSDAIARAGRIDVLLNNAGYALMGPFECVSDEQVRRQFDTNVFGLMAVTRAVLPHFRARGEGLVINVSSMVGRIPLPLYSVYNASKFAVEGYTEGLSYELESLGIRVKLIEPGAVKTNFFGRSSDRAADTGIRDYDRFAGEMLGVMDRIGAAGSTSEQAAEVIWQAANDDSTRLRYLVGVDAHAMVASRQLLPNRLFRAMIRFSLSDVAFRTAGRLLYRG